MALNVFARKLPAFSLTDGQTQRTCWQMGNGEAGHASRRAGRVLLLVARLLVVVFANSGGSGATVASMRFVSEPGSAAQICFGWGSVVEFGLLAEGTASC